MLQNNDYTNQSEMALVEPRTNKFLKNLFVLLLTLLLFVVGLYYALNWLNKAPVDFPLDVSITVPEGTSAKGATKLLSAANFVKSDLLLYFMLLYWHEPNSIKASSYKFSTPLSTREIAEQLTIGGYDKDLIKITLTEGESVANYAVKVAAVLQNFKANEFFALAKPVEGTIFPETYLVPKTYTAAELFALTTKTFAENIKPLQTEIEQHNLTLAEILILASIIERKANSPESMKLVSGILQERLRIGMALQVDASMEYVLGKPLSELTANDLKKDNPYNTYLYPGLPPTPIGNPGIQAIEAVLNPTPSEYLFYITGDDGNFYYAKDFDAHRINIARHLR